MGTIVSLVTSGIGGGSIVLIALKFFGAEWFNSWIKVHAQEQIDANKTRLNKEIEEFRAEADRELEKVRHESSVELARKNLVRQFRHDSFRSVITAINQLISSIDKCYDRAAEQYESLALKEVKTFETEIAGQMLLLDLFTTRTLDVAARIAYETVDDESGGPESNVIWERRERLEFIRTWLVRYFQSIVGLENESRPRLPLLIFGACYELSSYTDAAGGWPTKSAFRIDENTNPLNLVDLAVRNLNDLLAELARFVSYFESDPPTRGFFYDHLDRAKFYLKELEIESRGQ